ncbi:NAD(P)/FAD-dependent oxidoreductase [Thalassobellus sediminis]|uniref:NAD(P)/FAD-dependent oxidoreductase n=1 Tax=Thalassobellus sediminis TaxID=3367753 RepID=UPI0037B57D26
MERRKFIKSSAGSLLLVSLPTVNFNIFKIMNKRETKKTEVVIVGAGPAGLSAALFLARANRQVIIFDWGKKRMPEKAQIHEYLGFDGMKPREYFAKMRKEVEKYGALFVEEKVETIRKKEDCTFSIFSDSLELNSKALVLATGAADVLPEIPGLMEGWGTDIHVCPCFTGYELSGKKLALFGIQPRLAHLGTFLTSWSDDVTVIAEQQFSEEEMDILNKANVKVHVDKIKELVRSSGELSYISTNSGEKIETDGVFIATPIKANSDLTNNLCEVDENGFAVTDEFCQSSTKGLWVIGNAQDPKGHMSHASTDGTQVGPFVANYLVHLNLEENE